ncbi:MAG: MgtC/SapB family protein [Armatimonadota bacterium]
MAVDATGSVLPEFAFHEWQIALLRMGLALVAGGLIGMDREWRNKPAGLRTHAIVCLAAALAMMISIAMVAVTDTGGNIAYGVLTGIGFVGGGAILRFGKNIRGLVTGATIWSAAVIGLGFGLGWYFATGIATVLIVVSLFALQRFEALLNPSQRVVAIRAITDSGAVFPKKMLTELPEMQFEVLGVGYEPGYSSDNGCVCFEVRTPTNLSGEVLVSMLKSEDWVKDAEVVGDEAGSCASACEAPRPGSEADKRSE